MELKYDKNKVTVIINTETQELLKKELSTKKNDFVGIAERVLSDTNYSVYYRDGMLYIEPKNTSERGLVFKDSVFAKWGEPEVDIHQFIRRLSLYGKATLGVEIPSKVDEILSKIKTLSNSELQEVVKLIETRR